jgi:hypothetical protein
LESILNYLEDFFKQNKFEMIYIKKVNNYAQIEAKIIEKSFGNTIIDRLSGWADLEYTIIKLRCDGCTIMVFKPDTNLFKNISVGDTIKIEAKEWKPNVFHFKKFIK